MEFYVNPGKKLIITVDGENYMRHAIKTRFIAANEENYIDLIREYAADIYEGGDILSISENIIALCQNRIVRLEDMKIGWLANFLARHVHMTSAGKGLGNPQKMQVAIDQAGPVRIIFAAIIGGICRFFGKKGVFYVLAGHNVANIDGFCNFSFDYYLDKGVLAPENPNKVCNEIKEALGIDAMVVDANDIGVEILGKNDSMTKDDSFYAALIKDNPAGQNDESTPFILIRKAGKAVEKITEEQDKAEETVKETIEEAAEEAAEEMMEEAK